MESKLICKRRKCNSEITGFGFSKPYCSRYCTENDEDVPFEITDWNAYWSDRLS